MDSKILQQQTEGSAMPSYEGEAALHCKGFIIDCAVLCIPCTALVPSHTHYHLAMECSSCPAADQTLQKNEKGFVRPIAIYKAALQSNLSGTYA